MGSQKVYNKLHTILMNKIGTGDYNMINLEKKYLRIYLTYDQNTHELIVDILNETHCSYFDKSVKSIKIFCNNRSTSSIVREFKTKLLYEYKKSSEDRIVLIYNFIFFEYNRSFSSIINLLKKINTEMEELETKDDNKYEYILASNELWAENFFYIKKYSRDWYGRPVFVEVPLKYLQKKDISYICFCINLKYFYYFFEVDINEFRVRDFFSSIISRTYPSEEIDQKIRNNIIGLYNIIDIGIIKTSTIVFWPICEGKKISFIDKKYNVEIKNEKVRFIHEYGIYVYQSENFVISNDAKTIINEECFAEFHDFFRKISSMSDKEKIKSFEMFFVLIESENKLEYLFDKILNRPGSALNIVFAHLLLIETIIHEEELNKIIGSVQIVETRKMEITRDFVEKISKYRYKPSFITIKICLFLEAERFMNEKNLIDESLFDSLVTIGNLLKSKSTSKLYEKNNLDLITLFGEISEFYLEDINIFKNKVIEEIFKITSLFTGLENNKYEIINRLYTRTEVIDNFGFAQNEVKIVNDAISNVLLEKVREDEKIENIEKLKKVISFYKSNNRDKTHEKIQSFREAIKQTLRKLIRSKLEALINKIEDIALDKRIDIVYNKTVSATIKNDIKTRGIQIIENIFTCDNILDDITNQIFSIDKNVISDFINEEKTKFMVELKEKWDDQIIIIAKKQFHEVLMQSFKSNFSDDANIKAKNESKLERLNEILSDKERIDMTSPETGIQLHDNLILAMKKHLADDDEKN
ncbi:uncharacterized protein VNE69_06023 [Vairimorpha necatrix]|uniref:Uncharacterized protein n=1 Tax=Vairimorpha necatrix TaxID=6039 RepID=A0AAX4JCL3_9MICR